MLAGLSVWFAIIKACCNIPTQRVPLPVVGSVLPAARNAVPPRLDPLCRQLDSPSDMETATIVKRIVSNRQAYEERNAKKVKSEAAYYSKHKAYMAEG